MKVTEPEPTTIKDWGYGCLGLIILLVIWAVIGNLTERKPPAPPPISPPQLAKPIDPVAEKNRKREQLLRLGACAQIENALVANGYDVQVMPMRDNDRHIVIVGPPVNRLFVRQVANSGIGRRLKQRGICKVTFMRDQFTWVGEWDVFYGKIEALP